MANKLLQNLSGSWADKSVYDKNEAAFHEKIAKGFQFASGGSSGLAEEVAKARQYIKQSLQCMDGIAAFAGLEPSDNYNKLDQNLLQKLNDYPNLEKRVKELEEKVKKLEAICAVCPAPAIQICPAKVAPTPAPKKDDDDDDVDLFGSDSDNDDEKERIKNERLAAYEAKKSKKPVLIAKSSVILDVKPWDDETDMSMLEKEVRKVEHDGLLWGASKLVPVAYKIQKLQINCVVEDDKVSIDWLCDKILESEDYVQSVDIAAFNKI